MDDLLLGIDLGTSGTRAGLFSAAGEPLAEASEAAPLRRRGPTTFEVQLPQGLRSLAGNRIERRLSSMRGQFADQDAYAALLRAGDAVLYAVHELPRPRAAGELLHGTSIVHPGRVGEEYHMTKGHFHAVPETAEIYCCLHGRGMMVMETPEGDWAVEDLLPGRILYVPPRWAHRSVNTGMVEDLVTFFAYPANAGHDYGTIEQRGFRKLVVERDGRPRVVDNPRWLAPAGRV